MAAVAQERDEASRPTKKMRLGNEGKDDNDNNNNNVNIKQEHSPLYQSGNEGGPSEYQSPAGAAMDDGTAMILAHRPHLPHSLSEVDSPIPRHQRYESGDSEDKDNDGGRHASQEDSDGRSRRDDSRSSAEPSSPPATPHPSKPPEIKIQYKAKLILRGHRKGVSAVKFSPDGRWIASCCLYFPLSLIPPFPSWHQLANSYITWLLSHISRRRNHQNLGFDFGKTFPNTRGSLSGHINDSMESGLEDAGFGIGRQIHSIMGY